MRIRQQMLALVAATATAVSSFGAAFITDFNSGLPAGSGVSGTATVLGTGGLNNTGVLRITDNANDQIGAYRVNDLAGGIAVTNFRVVARIAIGGGTSRPADGFGIAFSSELPAGNWTQAEEPNFSGLTVTLDTWDNNGDDTAPALDIRYNTQILAYQAMDTNYNNASMREAGRAPAGPILTNSAGQPVNMLTYGTSPEVPANENYVPFLWELSNNRITLMWSNTVVFNGVEVTNYTPIVGGRFGFAARTGGANAEHLIDNLQIYVNFAPGPVTITDQPDSLTVVESREAVFTADFTGTPPYSIQWYSNNVAIPGATSPSYRIANPTTNMSGDVYTVQVTNEEQTTPVVSQNAVLTVNPRVITVDANSKFSANQVWVRYAKPVNLNGTYTLNPALGVQSVAHGANQSEVVLTTTAPLTANTVYSLTITGVTGQDGSPLENEPSVLSFAHGSAFCRSFDDGILHPGGILSGSAYISNTNGALHLTDAANSLTGWYFIPGSGTYATNLTVTWRNLVGGGGGGGADGMSLNWAPGLTPANGGTAEEGVGNGLSATIDTFDNGTGQDEGIEIKWRGQRVAYTKIVKDNPGNGDQFIRNNTFVDASFTVSNNVVTFNWSNQVVTATLTNFVPFAGNFLFMARTGGANDNHWIDDLCINDYTPLGQDVSFLQNPVDAAIITGQSATFSAIPAGSPAFRFQWYTNGVAVPNATNATYTVSNAARSADGLQVSVSAANAFSAATSSVATLTVRSNPRVVSAAFESNTRIKIVYNEPVDLNSGTYDLVGSGFFENFREYGTNHNTVIWVSDTPFSSTAAYILRISGVVNEETGDPLVPEPTDVEVRLRGSFFADFNNGTVPAGSSMRGSAYITNGVLHLTDTVASQNGFYYIQDPASGERVSLMFMSWKVLVGGGNAADGMSVSWGPQVTTSSGGSEVGVRSGISLEVDTFNNEANDVGLEVWYQDRRVAYIDTGINPIRRNQFVDASVLIVPIQGSTNATITYKFDQWTLTGTLTNWLGFVGANYQFAARTGGANDNHWIDDIAINAFFPGAANVSRGPQSTNIFVGQTANFAVLGDGTPPYSFQWFTNGVAVAGATSSSFTIANAQPSQDGLEITVEVRNEFGSQISAPAILGIRRDPRLVSINIQGSNTLVVTFTEAVDPNSGTYTIEMAGGGSAGTVTSRTSANGGRSVILTLDTPLNMGGSYTANISGVTGAGTGTPQTPDPINTTTTFVAGSFCADFNDNALPAGTQLSGPARIADGYVHLIDDGQASVQGGFSIADPFNGANVTMLNARWRSLIGGVNQAGEAEQLGSGGADGYSFNWGTDVPVGGGSPDGLGTGLSVTIDTFDNGGEAPSVAIEWRGQRLAANFIVPNDKVAAKATLRKNQFVDVEVQVNPDGTAIVNYDGYLVSATIPNWTGIAGGRFLFGGSTGGAQDNHWIDDVQLNCFTAGPVAITEDLQDAVTGTGSATIGFDIAGTPPYNITWFSNDVQIVAPSYRLLTTTVDPGTSTEFYAIVDNNLGNSVTTRVATVVSRARISIARGNDQSVTLTWPGTGWVLQANDELGDTNGWQDLPQFSTSPLVIPPGFFGNGATNVFFRLKHGGTQ